MSLPGTKPNSSPELLNTRPSSGSGTFHAESTRIPTGSPGPTTREAGALKNSSGRGAT